jgi:hypothetical protein
VAEGVRENGEEANERERGFQRGSRVIKGRGVLGLWWVASDAIGRRGRFPWTALWSECRGIGGVVGAIRFGRESTVFKEVVVVLVWGVVVMGCHGAG